MRESFWRGGEYGPALLDLVACVAGFGLAALIEQWWMGDEILLRPEPQSLQLVLSMVVGWLVLVFPESQWHEGVRLWIDGFFTVTGSTVLLQCGLAYIFKVQPASWLIIILGSFFSIAAAGTLRKWHFLKLKGGRKGVLWVGYDAMTVPLVEGLGEDIVGGIGHDFPAAPSALPVVGGLEQLNEVCDSQRFSVVVLSGKPTGIPFAQLLRLHYSGIEVESAPFLYERILHRVPWQYSQPSDLLFFLNPHTSRTRLAFKAIYKNLLGLGLLALLVLVLLFTSLLIVVSTGGPALEHIECLGFQRIPFQLLRFRIRQADGSLSRIGKVIAKLRLTNLPQLANVVRGEMALFGPAPVRTVFANRLAQLLPAYVYRFTVKPGILGWAQAESVGLPEEITRLEYDFDYIKQESPSLDLNILLRMLLRPHSERGQKAVVSSIEKDS